MIRWSYVAPRMLILAAVCFVVGFISDPVAKTLLISTGQLMFGAKVEIGGVTTSLVDLEASVEDVAVANPQDEFSNLVELKQLWLNFDTAALLRKRFVIEQAAVSGVRFNTERETSGKLAERPIDPNQQARNEAFRAKTRAWLEGVGETLAFELESQLESVRLAKALNERWPQKYKELEARTETWLTEARRLRELPNALRNTSPAEQYVQLNQASAKVKDLRLELAAIKEEVGQLKRQVEIDREQVTAALKNDRQKVRDMLTVGAIEPQEITEYLLGEELAGHIETTIGWLKRIRSHIPSNRNIPKPQRSRGLDFVFPLERPEPALLVRTLHLDGQIGTATPVSFAGQVLGLSNNPSLYGKPLVVRMKTNGESPVWIELSADRTTEVHTDQLKIICPHLAMPAQSLGNNDLFALDIPAGSAQFVLDVTMQGEYLQGSLLVRRTELSITPRVGEKLASRFSGDRLARILAEVQKVDVEVALTGTLSDPHWHLHSDLGGDVLAATKGVLLDELATRQKQLEDAAQTEVRKQLDELTENLAAKKQILFDKLRLADEQGQQLSQVVPPAAQQQLRTMGRELMRDARMPPGVNLPRTN